MISTGVAIIILGAIIRTLGMNRLPKLVFVLIWTVASLRLLLPFSIPAPQLVSHTNQLNTVPEILTSALTEQLPLALPPQQAASPSNDRATNLLHIIWFLGTAAGALYFFTTHYKFRKEMSDALPVRSAFISAWQAENRLLRRVEIRQTHKVDSPLTYGVFRPVILLPAGLKRDGEGLGYIFAHEYTHIRRFDYVLKILFAAVLCVHWFNPFVWLMFVLANRDIELSCDEAVLGTFGEKSKCAYALTLLEMAAGGNHFVMSNGFSYGNLRKAAIEERIRVMVNMKKKSIFGAVTALVLVVVMAACSTAEAAAPVQVQFRISAAEVLAALENFETGEYEEMRAFWNDLMQRQVASEKIVLYDDNWDYDLSLSEFLEIIGAENWPLPIFIYDLGEALSLHAGDNLAVPSELAGGFVFRSAWFDRLHCPRLDQDAEFAGYMLNVLYASGEQELWLQLRHQSSGHLMAGDGNFIERSINGRSVIVGSGGLSFDINGTNHTFTSRLLTRAEMIRIAESF